MQFLSFPPSLPRSFSLAVAAAVAGRTEDMARTLAKAAGRSAWWWGQRRGVGLVVSASEKRERRERREGGQAAAAAGWLTMAARVASMAGRLQRIPLGSAGSARAERGRERGREGERSQGGKLTQIHVLRESALECIFFFVGHFGLRCCAGRSLSFGRRLPSPFSSCAPPGRDVRGVLAGLCAAVDLGQPGVDAGAAGGAAGGGKRRGEGEEECSGKARKEEEEGEEGRKAHPAKQMFENGEREREGEREGGKRERGDGSGPRTKRRSTRAGAAVGAVAQSGRCTRGLAVHEAKRRDKRKGEEKRRTAKRKKEKIDR